MTAELRELLGGGLRTLDADGSLAAPGAGGDGIMESVSVLLVIDLEMSGSNPQMHEVLDVGAVKARLDAGLPEEGSWGQRVRPKHIGNASPGALKVTGYSPKAWKDAIELEEAFERLAGLGEGAMITGWGIGQDMAFLAESFRRVGREWPFAPAALDVQPIARALLKGTGDVDRFNLGHVADRLGIGRMGEHTALADAFATYDVLVKLVERALAGGAAGTP